ncbi:glycosyltransferase [Stenotrophomonas nitritireducens]|uniref:glycosyltransferase n=1 Tax=Stenotrophomonas nitritireducens TaxID=83617 RepID=UPI003D97008E
MILERPACEDTATLLSIVVLVYNTAQYLPACFDSLLQQDYRNIEIIAIDDASTDDSLAICRDYAQRYPNFFCVSKHNEGGAVSGNLGVSLARGRYVALVDSDDKVTRAGYRLLMEQALQAEADIVIGRAARLQNDKVSSVAFLYEPYVWSRRRSFDSVAEFPDVIHDCFYWNKVFRTEFLRGNGLGMVPGLLYADRPFVHRAYWYSRRTVIVPELVYYWRQRPEGAASSISQNIRQADNFIDRIRSMMLEWHDFDAIPEAADYRRAIAVANLQRALHAAPGIVGSPAFRRAFIAAMQQLIALYGDLDWRALGARRCLYLELIKRGELEGLCFLLGVTSERGWIAEIDGACYWKQPFLDNPEVALPRASMRLEFPNIGFFRVEDISLDEDCLGLTLELHDRIMAGCEVRFELHSLDGEGSWEFQPGGRTGEHRWRYRLDMRVPEWRSGGLYGLVLHYRAADGIHGRYRIGPAMVPPGLPASLPLRSSLGSLAFSPEAGGLGLAVN